MVETLQKSEGEYNDLAKEGNNMKVVFNTSATRLGEEGTKTIKDLMR